MNLSILVPPALVQFWEQKAKAYGPVVAGALFGAGWWFWVDAVVCYDRKVPFDQYIPGIIATIAIIMINCVRRDDLQDYDPFDDGGFCRSRFWLFLSYLVSFGAMIGSVWVLLQHYALQKTLEGAEVWPGVAGIFQVTFILGAGLLFFIARTSSSDGNGYSSF